MTTHPLCEQFQISASEIQARRAFLGFTREDDDNLERIHAVIAAQVDDIIAEFYTHLAQFEELGRFLGDRPTLERLQRTQRQYLLGLGRGAGGFAYFADRLRIGLAHERVGLEPKWYLGAYFRLFDVIGRRLTTTYAERPEQLAGLLITLQKVFTLDSVLAVETYYRTMIQRLEDTLQELTRAQHALRELSRLDGLTRVSNRMFLMESLETELGRSRRFGHPFSLLLIDLDHFKQVNDRYGHIQGDRALQQVVERVRSVIRPADIIGRYGGEEFVIGLVETDQAAAEQVAERIRLQVAHAPIEADSERTCLTVSIGLATLNNGVERIEPLIDRADRAMYRAKAAGRNRVWVARE